jgi:hypothetical protein
MLTYAFVTLYIGSRERGSREMILTRSQLESTTDEEGFSESERPERFETKALRLVRASLPEELRARVRSARELGRDLSEAEPEEPPLSTALPALDRLLQGGLPRGQMVEMIGARSSGRFSAVLSLLAAATSVGEAAALIDLGDGFDPATATAAGVDLERLLWARPTRLKHALAAAEMLLASGFPLVALDLGMPPVRGGRGAEAAWLRLARAARDHEAVLLIASPYRLSGTSASLVLQAERARAVWQGEGNAPRLLGGARSRVRLEKGRGRLPGQSEEIDFVLAEAPPAPVRPRTAPKARPQTVASPEAPAVTIWEEPVRAAAGRR